MPEPSFSCTWFWYLPTSTRARTQVPERSSSAGFANCAYSAGQNDTSVSPVPSESVNFHGWFVFSAGGLRATVWPTIVTVLPENFTSRSPMRTASAGARSSTNVFIPLSFRFDLSSEMFSCASNAILSPAFGTRFRSLSASIWRSVMNTTIRPVPSSTLKLIPRPDLNGRASVATVPSTRTRPKFHVGSILPSCTTGISRFLAIK